LGFKTVAEMQKKYKLSGSGKVDLSELRTRDSGSFFASEDEAKDTVAKDVKKMGQLQQRFNAEGNRALLLIFQGMDTAGKDSCIRHLFSGMNPEGCTATSFKVPTALELSHDFMWRHYAAMPGKGTISIFNRSYYENVLVTRVHPELLLSEKIPAIQKPGDAGEAFWESRFETINAFEKGLTESGTTILKFFLHISKEEQKSRLLARIDDETKNWKFSLDDVKERAYWKDYSKAYEDMLRHTSTRYAPWWVIPSDEKWFSRAVMGRIVVNTMEKMDLHFPEMGEKQKAVLKKAGKKLEGK
jgi:PPK2 family polyphosphate:nucleotide phosphotransferase